MACLFWECQSQICEELWLVKLHHWVIDGIVPDTPLCKQLHWLNFTLRTFYGIGMFSEMERSDSISQKQQSECFGCAVASRWLKLFSPYRGAGWCIYRGTSQTVHCKHGLYTSALPCKGYHYRRTLGPRSIGVLRIGVVYSRPSPWRERQMLKYQVSQYLDHGLPYCGFVFVL